MPATPTASPNLPPTPRPGSTQVDGATNRSLRKAMAEADPQATVQSLIAALPDSFAVVLEPMVSRTFPISGETRREFLGWRLTGPVSDQDRSSVSTLVKLSLMPMPSQELTKRLVELRVTTRTKAESPELVDLQLEIYAQKLENWPADVVRSVLSAWNETNIFWPAWAELVDLMEPLTRKRRALLEVLEKKAEGDAVS